MDIPTVRSGSNSPTTSPTRSTLSSSPPLSMSIPDNAESELDLESMAITSNTPPSSSTVTAAARERFGNPSVEEAEQEPIQEEELYQSSLTRLSITPTETKGTFQHDVTRIKFSLSRLLKDMIYKTCGSYYQNFHGIANRDSQSKAQTICYTPDDVDALIVIAKRDCPDLVDDFERQKEEVHARKFFLSKKFQFTDIVLDNLSLLALILNHYRRQSGADETLRESVFNAAAIKFSEELSVVDYELTEKWKKWPLSFPWDNRKPPFPLFMHFSVKAWLNIVDVMTKLSLDGDGAAGMCIHTEAHQYFRSFFPIGMHLVKLPNDQRTDEERKSGIQSLIDLLPNNPPVP